MARPVGLKLYDAQELAALIKNAETLLSNARRLLTQGEAKAFAMAKQGLPTHDCNVVGRVAFRDAGQLCLEAMQLIADTQGKNLATLSGDELDDLSDFGFRWGNFAQLGSPVQFTHFSVANVTASILGSGTDDGVVITAISKADRDHVAAGKTSDPPNPWGYIGDSAYPPSAAVTHATAAIQLQKFPDLEGQEATKWGHVTDSNNAFSYDAAGYRYYFEEGDIFGILRKFTWTGDLNANDGITADTDDVLNVNLSPIQRSGEQALKLSYVIPNVALITNAADRNAPVSSEFFMIREIATGMEYVDGSE